VSRFSWGHSSGVSLQVWPWGVSFSLSFELQTGSRRGAPAAWPPKDKKGGCSPREASRVKLDLNWGGLAWQARPVDLPYGSV
jgi:hypothetical protein